MRLDEREGVAILRFLLAILIISCCCASAQAVTIGEAKKLADDEPVSLSGVIPTAGWEIGSGMIKAYVQEQDRSAGIAIYVTEALTVGGGPGLPVSLSGTMDTVDGERCINVTGCEWLSGPVVPKPLFVPNFGNWQGLNPGGLYIRSCGVVTECPDYSGGVYPDYFRFSDGSGEIKAINLYTSDPILLPVAGEQVMVSGVASPVEKTILYQPEFEVWMLGTITFSSGVVRGYAHLYWDYNPPAGVSVSGPGTDGWQSGWWEGEHKWVCNWPMSDPQPAVPAEYQFRFVESGRTSQYKGWITDYVNDCPTNLSPSSGSVVWGTGPITFSWTPPTDGPFCETTVMVWGPSGDVGRFDADSDTSFTYSGQLQPGQYYWQVEFFRPDDNGCISGATLYYNYNPDDPPPPPLAVLHSSGIWSAGASAVSWMR